MALKRKAGAVIEEWKELTLREAARSLLPQLCPMTATELLIFLFQSHGSRFFIFSRCGASLINPKPYRPSLVHSLTEGSAGTPGRG